MLLIALFIVDSMNDNFIDELKNIRLSNAKIISRKFFKENKKALLIAQLSSREYVDEAIIELKEAISGIASRFNIKIVHDVYSISSSEPINPYKIALARFYSDILKFYLDKSIKDELLRELKIDLDELIFLLFVHFSDRIASDQLIELINWLYGYSVDKALRILRSLEDNELIIVNENMVSLSILGASRINKFLRIIEGHIYAHIDKLRFESYSNFQKGMTVVLSDGVIAIVRNRNDLNRLLSVEVPENAWRFINRLYVGKTINLVHLKAIVDNLSRILSASILSSAMQ